jgi:glycosyltransferase involved in cell wall biosynthesis
MNKMLRPIKASRGDPLPSVLIMSHSHPMETRGGAEIAALALFRGLKARSATAWFLGCAGPKSESRLGAPLTQPYGEDDYVYHPAAEFDYFKFANPDVNFPKTLGTLISKLKPDIVHSHHFMRFGVESFSIIKRSSPHTKIVLSLHEFLAICNHHGQMVKTKSMHLCDRASYSACSGCFPQYKARDFFLRKRYIQTFFDDVDLFVAPSQFLADRFNEWGVPPEKLVTLENMPPAKDEDEDAVASVAAARPQLVEHPALKGRPRTGATIHANVVTSVRATAQNHPLRFGFFGQMSPLKGITVLIEAAQYLNKQGVSGATIEIHGDYSNQPPAFQEVVTKALDDAGRSVIYHGAYDNRDVNKLMRQMDAIIVPSTWWENSPVVIQEAFTNGKPVICSDIGGMAEKVRHGIDGLHFAVSQPFGLARAIMDLVQDPGRLAQLTAGVQKRMTTDEALDAHLRFYRFLINPRVLGGA